MANKLYIKGIRRFNEQKVIEKRNGKIKSSAKGFMRRI